MLLATIGGAPIPHVTSCNLKHLAMPGPPKQTVQYRERLGMDQTKVNTINTKTWPDFRALASQFQPRHNCSSGASAYAQSFHSKGGPASPFWPCGSQDFPGDIPWRVFQCLIFWFCLTLTHTCLIIRGGIIWETPACLQFVCRNLFGTGTLFFDTEDMWSNFRM